MADGGPQLGRWCRTCRQWVSLRDRSCPECRGKVGGPELMPAGTVPLTRKKPKAAPAAPVRPSPSPEPAPPPQDFGIDLPGSGPGGLTAADSFPPAGPPPTAPAPPPPPTAPPPPAAPLSPPPAPPVAPTPSPPVDDDPFAVRDAAHLPPPPSGAFGVEDRAVLPPPPGGDPSGGWAAPGDAASSHLPPPPPAEPVGRPVPPVRGGWNELPPIKGVPDEAPAPTPPSAPETIDDGLGRETLIKVVVGAVGVLVVGFILLELFTGGEGDQSADEAPEIPPATVQPSIPFSVPGPPAEEPLEEGVEVAPEEWDPLVRDLIPWIEEERNLRFKEPVAIEAATTAELQQRYPVGGIDPLTAEYLNARLGMYRAMGMFEGSPDFTALANRDASNAVVGFYDPNTKQVTVSTDAGGPDAHAFRRAVLVHELVHALQDQHFGGLSPTSVQRITMQRMMWEGDAVRVETAYSRTMSEADRAAYQADEASLRRSSELGVLEVLGVEGDFIYLGGHQVTRLARILDSSRAVDRLVEYPPTRPAQLLRVSNLFLHQGQPWASETPMPDYPLPQDGFLLDGDSMGAWLWYVAMASHIDPLHALRAADAIGTDRYVLFERNGQICANFEVVASGAGDVGHLASGIRAWAAAVPHAPTVTVADRAVRVESCDPGAGAPMNFARPPQELVDIPIARLKAVSDVLTRQRGWWADEPLRERQRWCLAETVQRAVRVDEALAGLPAERLAELGQAAVTTCLPDRVPGGPRPVEGECSSAGMDPALDDAGLPPGVVEARRALIRAAAECDYTALRETLAASGPYLGDAQLPAPDRANQVVDRWRRLESLQRPVLAELVAALTGGWLCGSDVQAVIEGRTGPACAFLSGGRGPVDDNAWVLVIGQAGGVLGFGANGDIQGDVLEQWAESVTGERSEGYTTGGGTASSGAPRNWPVAVPPVAQLEES